MIVSNDSSDVKNDDGDAISSNAARESCMFDASTSNEECKEEGSDKDSANVVVVVVEGIITRRRCLGKKLAFCDISVGGGGEASDAAADGSTGTIIIMPLAFRRAAFRGDPATFPTKNAALPFGAVIQVQVVRNHDSLRQGRRNENASSSSSSTGSSSPATSSSPSSCPHEVLEWKILQHPHDTAVQAAALSSSLLSSSSSDGISCTKYLRARRQAFDRATATAASAAAGYKNDNNQRHGQKRSQRRQQQQSSQQQKSTIATRSTDMNDSHGGGGSLPAKALRSRVFAAWIRDHLLNENRKSDAILDIAGGKGDLSVELAALTSCPCTVVDPLQRQRNEGTTNCSPLRSSQRKRLRKLGAPVPNFVAESFQLNNQNHHHHHHAGNNNNNESLSSSSSTTSSLSTTMQKLVDEHSILVGMHPDQCTEDILDVALAENKSVAIVPCCVYPSLFPHRRRRRESPLQHREQELPTRDDASQPNEPSLQLSFAVNTYKEFIAYLLDKDERLQSCELPFEGKNVIIYLKQ